MKPSLQRYLVCPSCGSCLELRSSQEEGGEILGGELLCGHCPARFPIVRGIPRLQPGVTAADKARTADAFGWEWQEFAVLHGVDEYRSQFLDWIHPIKPEFFEGKVVLDAGCGMGRFARIASLFGSRDVLAIDLSDAVEAAYRNTVSLPNVHVIQADVYHLPLRQGPAADVDFSYSIGVLHHLPDPEAGFHAMTQHTKPGGAAFGWVYGFENNEWIVRYVNPLREGIFSKMPRRMLYFLSFLLAAGLHPALVLFYRPEHTFRKHLPQHGYLSWLAQYGFRHTHHVIFDHLVAPTAFYIKREDFESWFDRAGLVDVHISCRNENSWRGLGFKPREAWKGLERG